ncbi:MAG: cytochrome c-type biogenesis protein CcmH [Rhodospirillaceae bacterium]|nr:cytochrome c-type biogenesis protein CcmH [Rhodospirillaceae bacterium]
MRIFLFIAALLAAPLCAPALSPLVPSEALALQPDEILKDPALEARAREISKELRCLVCQNQSIDDSDATLARDLRILVRDRLTAGDTDTEAVDFIVERYGDFVLLRPPFKNSTLILWIGPGVIFAIGIFGVTLWHRRRRVAVAAPVAPLSADERARVDAMLAEKPDQ